MSRVDPSDLTLCVCEECRSLSFSSLPQECRSLNFRSNIYINSFIKHPRSRTSPTFSMMITSTRGTPTIPMQLLGPVTLPFPPSRQSLLLVVFQGVHFWLGVGETLIWGEDLPSFWGGGYCFGRGGHRPWFDRRHCSCSFYQHRPYFGRRRCSRGTHTVSVGQFRRSKTVP